MQNTDGNYLLKYVVNATVTSKPLMKLHASITTFYMHIYNREMVLNFDPNVTISVKGKL